MSVAKSRRSIGFQILTAIVPLLIIAGGVGALFGLPYLMRKEPELAKDGPSVPRAIVMTARNHVGGMTIRADGVVVPYREIEISAEVSGRIIERAEICRAGNYVKKGQLLVRIDPQDYQLEVDRLEKELQQSKVALDELREQIRGAEDLIEIAERDLELRTRELTRLQKIGRKAISVSDLEKTEVTELQARNTVVTLRNRVQLLNVGRARLESARDLSALKLKKARLDLERTRIVSPVDGVIVRDLVEEDAFVQPGAQLLRVEDTTRAEVRCKLEMEDLYWLWDSTNVPLPAAQKSNSKSTVAQAYGIPNLPVEVVYRLAGRDDIQYVWQGRLDRFDGIGLDENTRTVPCRVVVDDPRARRPTDRSGPPALLRGMYVTVHIHVMPKTPLLEIPEAGVRPGDKVWCVRDGKLAIVPIHFVTVQKTVDAEGKKSSVALVYVSEAARSGDSPPLLAAGDQVIVSPLVFVRSGMRIEISRVRELGSEKTVERPSADARSVNSSHSLTPSVPHDHTSLRGSAAFRWRSTFFSVRPGSPGDLMAHARRAPFMEDAS